jgi:hypothetical protein
MALLGHKFTQTPHFVHLTRAITWGFLFLPSSKTPSGQTPIQICPIQGPHFVASIIGIYACPYESTIKSANNISVASKELGMKISNPYKPEYVEGLTSRYYSKWVDGQVFQREGHAE